MSIFKAMKIAVVVGGGGNQWSVIYEVGLRLEALGYKGATTVPVREDYLFLYTTESGDIKYGNSEAVFKRDKRPEVWQFEEYLLRHHGLVTFNGKLYKRDDLEHAVKFLPVYGCSV